MDPREIIENALKEGRFKLLEHEAIDFIKSYGIPVAEAYLAHSPSEAVEIAEKLGYPVVLKVVSPDISHKSDVGGVVIGLNNSNEVREAYNRIMEIVPRKAPNSRITGVLVQKMARKGGLEVIVGGLRDSVFGPVVMFGLGGIFVEVLKDVSFRVAPVSIEDALEMLSEIKSSKILEGYRNTPPVKKEALADIIVRVAKLLDENSEVDSLDLNPIMAYPDHALVVDARVILKKR